MKSAFSLPPIFYVNSTCSYTNVIFCAFALKTVPANKKRESSFQPISPFAVRGTITGNYNGAWQTAAKIVSLSYLWNVIRVQGGAYGTGMLTRANGGFYCYSYRDPSARESLRKYLDCSSFLKEFAAQNPDLTWLYHWNSFKRGKKVPAVPMFNFSVYALFVVL